jgi:hypothetical protein
MSISISSPNSNTGKIQVNGVDRISIGTDGVLTGSATPAQFDNSTKIATTAFIQRALGSYRDAFSVSTTTTLDANSIGKICQISSTGPYTVTLPSVADIPTGGVIQLVCTGTGTFTIAAQASQNISYAFNSSISSFTMVAGDTATLVEGGGFWSIQEGSKLLQFLPQFGASLISNGYQKLPSGLILQWGTNSNTGASTAVTFPIVFPSSCVHLSYGSFASALATAGNYYQIAHNSVTASGFNWGSLTSAGAVNTTASTSTLSWLAIGY